MRDIVIFGAGGFGKEILSELIVNHKDEYNVLGFIDDGKVGQQVLGFNIIGDTKYLIGYSEKLCVVVCIGEISTKKKIVEKIKQNINLNFPNIISKSAELNQDLITLGEGNIIYNKAQITANFIAGNFNYLAVNTIISHDCILGSYISLSPSVTLCGGVKINDETYVGAGSILRERITIGSNSIIGMGSTVVKDVPSNVVALGSPCKISGKKSADEKVFK